ncbi:bifunctional molybdenum cofactor biosynthesis protein MoaC/MoaB [Dinghuibacter silviterrae]|uniref:Molybdopterin adenylyltransferase n=1 Tax=Dinghuibacter silviterrae TaxID=1539049 RepID=A0A4R8DSM4_9BACT|nr:bifunctional molybdenum cofactor biosynthesis protein MoaC/MoaB [Dinghuibacter silviterrae]TDX01230.1 molybdenum cofactor biosynthesis protein MoaC [Dinghuibacter silviterrae]
MNDITQKVSSLRKAIALATLTVSSPDTIAAVEERRVPKGDVFEFSRAAGLLAIKRTSDVIPDCHPLPVEYAAITHRIEGLHIHVRVEVHTVYRTGVEVEAMHGAAITALTMYDMLKPLDKGIGISDIRLESKKGGKSDFGDRPSAGLRCAVVVCSDSVAKGTKTDSAGKAIIKALQAQGLSVGHYAILPDEAADIRAKAKTLKEDGYDLVLFTGGTGLSPRDVTPEAIAPLLDRPVPGIMEAARVFGQERTPYAMLSRGVAGFIGKTLVLTLPGSTKGAEETMHALFPQILHIFRVAEGSRHEG